MLQRCSAAVFVAMLLLVVASILVCLSPFSSRVDDDAAQTTNKAAHHLPIDVRMDRDDVANVTKTQVSWSANAVLSYREIADVAAVHLTAPVHRVKQHTPINKQQHVFRI
jgi:hypothetical protein